LMGGAFFAFFILKFCTSLNEDVFSCIHPYNEPVPMIQILYLIVH
jgi:hypothetical protein